MKIILNNGKELSAILVIGGPRMVQGASRDTLNFIFPATEDMAELDSAFSAENCEKITIIGDDGSENIHTGYTIRAEMSKAAVEVTPATESEAAVYEDRITVAMSQRTYAETQLAENSAAIDDIILSMLEV